MQNAENNPPQQQQKEIAAKSPVKTPATGSTGPDAATQAREFESHRRKASAEADATSKRGSDESDASDRSVNPPGTQSADR